MEIYDQFWKLPSWDQRRQFIANNVKKSFKARRSVKSNFKNDRKNLPIAIFRSSVYEI